MGKLTQSYVHGASDLPLIGDTIGVHLDRMADLSPDRPALIARQQEIRWSYGEFRDRVEALAAGLLGLGLLPGDRLGIWSPNNSEWVLTQFASAKAGLILVNINPAYRLHELDYVLNKVGCRGLILASSFKTSDYIAMIRGLCPELDQAKPGLLESRKVPSLRWVIRLGSDKTAGMLNFAEIAAAATSESRRRLGELAAELQFDDPINIQFTSGTTGFRRAPPSPTTTSSTTASSSARACGSAPTTRSASRSHSTTASAWCWAISPASPIAPAWWCPAKASIPWRCWRPSRRNAAPGCMGYPPWSSQSSIIPLCRVRSLEPAHRHHGRQPCPIEVMKRCTEKMHMREITIAYGMTETSGQLPELDRRSHRAAGLDRRAHPAPSRGQDRRAGASAPWRGG
jgi:fatty-acyl-CoA synthase